MMISSSRFVGIAVLCTALVGVACGESEEAEATSDPVNEVVIPECEGDALAFETTSTNIYAGISLGGYVVAQALQEADGSWDQINVEMIAGRGGPNDVGKYYVDSTTLRSERGLDIIYGVGCSESGCQKTYRAEHGSVTVRPFGNRQGESVTVTLESLHFVEVTAESTGDYSVVPGTTKICSESLRIEGTVPAGQGGPHRVEAYAETSPACVSSGNGRGLGNNIATLEFETCAGTTVSLHDLYCGGGDRAVWFATSAMWCGPCLVRDPLYYDLALKNDNVDFYVILGQDSNGGDNFAAECAQGFGVERVAGIGPVPPENVLMDPGWNDTDWLMMSYGSQTIPYARVLNGNNMEYIWTDYANDGSTFLLEQALQEAMGDTPLVGWEQLLVNEEAL